MVAYLSQSGAVLGFNGGPISLKVLYATGSLQSLVSDGSEVGDFMYDRIYTASAQAPFRVNPFAVEDGDAPDPDPWPPSPISYSLAAWDGYIFAHWDSFRAKSTNFDLEAFDYDSADFRWVTASGYENHPQSLTQYLYVDDCTHPCDATVSDCCGANLGDVLTHTITGLNPNTTYTATITTLWDERATGFNKQESDVATLASPLTEGDNNAVGTGQIYFTTTACPNCTALGTTNIRLTNTDPVGICFGGSTTVYANSSATTIGALNIGDCLFTVKSGSPCAVCSSGVGNDFAEDGSNYVELAGGCVVSPGPQACGGICLHYDMLVVVLKTKKEQLINVYDVRVGDLIKTETGYTKVTQIITNHIREGYYIIEGDLKITNDHPFMYNDEWITSEEYRGEKIYVSGDVPTVYIGTEEDGYITYGDKSQWVVSGKYKKCD
jgi:hypothetical protein